MACGKVDDAFQKEGPSTKDQVWKTDTRTESMKSRMVGR